MMRMRSKWKKSAMVALAVTGLWGSGVGQALSAEQYLGLPSYRVGAYAAGGSGIFGGWIDYMQMINERDGGVNGVKLVWEECETEYNNARGVECYERFKAKGNTFFSPLSTGITYSVLDRVAQDKIPLVTIGYGRSDAADGRVFPWVFPLVTHYWSQASAMINFIGKEKLGSMDQLKGKKIVLLYHDSAYGKEPHEVLKRLSQKWGFELELIPVAHPGNEQQSQWLQIRQIRPDFVILWGWGVMNPTALSTAKRTGFPIDKIIGVWWAGAEEDVIPAGSASTGYIAAGFNAVGDQYPVIQDIKKYVYAKGKGNLDPKRVGSVYYNRGVVHGIIYVEAVRLAQEHFNKKGQPVTGEEIRWALEHLNFTPERLKQLGADGFLPVMQTSCMDHEGAGVVKFQQWDGSKWKMISDWIVPDRVLVRQLVEESAAKYAQEKGITPRDCSKEG
ncbi:ABC transporter permease [Hydrogenophilus thermoluteolus]|uniref:ABC transporter permease n=2 Tax=Hydrogenophilus thermoluteolus TaxID=297 RepID=A0A2Z6DVP9_HYDTE|nr:ABC transporter substrate-binding protein [Hydrogenophilus thermoluteolus]BBD76503.1 ABC transporter permease [Hydrogenophilus thermoluteolus]